MKVQHTALMEELLTVEELAKLEENFIQWKSSDDEFSSYFFGKDSFFDLPNEFKYLLKHVHVVPLNTEELDKWVGDDETIIGPDRANT